MFIGKKKNKTFTKAKACAQVCGRHRAWLYHLGPRRCIFLHLVCTNRWYKMVQVCNRLQKYIDYILLSIVCGPSAPQTIPPLLPGVNRGKECFKKVDVRCCTHLKALQGGLASASPKMYHVNSTSLASRFFFFPARNSLYSVKRRAVKASFLICLSVSLHSWKFSGHGWCDHRIIIVWGLCVDSWWPALLGQSFCMYPCWSCCTCGCLCHRSKGARDRDAYFEIKHCMENLAEKAEARIGLLTQRVLPQNLFPDFTGRVKLFKGYQAIWIDLSQKADAHVSNNSKVYQQTRTANRGLTCWCCKHFRL